MSIIQNLYHGTTCQISIFKPFSHFGNKDVALDAIARKIVDYDKNQAFLMDISLHAPEEQILELEDWGAPNSQGLASALKWASEGKEKERFQEILNGISKDREEENPLWNEIGFENISKILRDRNILILKYKNDVEGCKSSYSYCAIDSNAVTIVSQKPVEMSELEEKVAKWKLFNEIHKRS